MKAIAHKNLPAKPMSIIWIAAIWFLLLAHFHAPAWLYAIVFTIHSILFISLLIVFFKEESVDILGEDK